MHPLSKKTLFLTQESNAWRSAEPTLWLWVTSPAPRPPPHRRAGWLLNCVAFIDESAQCCWDRGGALRSRAERWNAPIEENTDGQPRSAARRPVPRHGMPIQREQPQRKCDGGRQGKGWRVSWIVFIFILSGWGCKVPGEFRRRCACALVEVVQVLVSYSCWSIKAVWL